MQIYTNSLATIVIMLFLTSTTQAELHDRENGMIYDDVQNITWLQDANLPASEQFGISTIVDDGSRHSLNGYGIRMDEKHVGRMNWQTALDWIKAMNSSNEGKGYKGFNDWHLWTVPDAAESCYGKNCTDSELSNLYKTLKSNKDFSILNITSTDFNLFKHIQSAGYWSGVSYSHMNSSAWTFYISDGRQVRNHKDSSQLYVWAVRSGDIKLPASE